MEQTLIYLQAYSQDISLHSQNCCHVALKTQLDSSAQPSKKTHTKMQNIRSREKGIKLTHTKSSHVIPSSKIISQKRGDTFFHNMERSSLRKINIDNSAKFQDLAENSQIKNTKKCIEYKNRKIVERTSTQQTSAQNCAFLASGSQGSKKSMEKYTPRTTIKTEDEYLQLSQLVDKNLQLSWILSPEKQTVQRDGLVENRFFRPTKSKKTLTKLYEQELGRRVVTVQSQDEDSDSDHVSIIEPFQWRISLS